MYKRKLKRRHLIYYLRVYDRQRETLLGHLADITIDGMMLMSEVQIQAGTDFAFRMTLPEGFEKTREITFEARSIWSKKDVNPDFYATGFKFNNINPDDEALIETLINDFGFRD